MKCLIRDVWMQTLGIALCHLQRNQLYRIPARKGCQSSAAILSPRRRVPAGQLPKMASGEGLTIELHVTARPLYRKRWAIFSRQIKRVQAKGEDVRPEDGAVSPFKIVPF